MKKSNLFVGGITGLALVTSLAAGSAHAADSSSSTTSAKKVAPKLIDKITMSYGNLFVGGSVTKPHSSLQPSTDKDTYGQPNPKAPIFMQHVLATGYKLTDKVTASAVFDMITVPVQGKKVTIRDPYARISHGSLLSKGSFNMYADARAYAPVSTASQKNGRIVALGSKQVSSFEVPKTKLTLGAITFVSVGVFSDATGKDNIILNAYPNLDYKILPNLSAIVGYDMNAKHVGGEKLTSLHNDGTSLEPGVSWDINPAMNLSPFLSIKTGTGVTADTTQLAAQFSWKLL